MKLIGINFKAEMVRAVRREHDPKTQTRRNLSARNCLVDGVGMSQKRWDAMGFDFAQAWIDAGPSPSGNSGPYLQVPAKDGTVHRIYPRVQVGDHLWGRENFAHEVHALAAMRDEDGPFVYAADPGSIQYRLGERWRPSIHMPLYASRIRLEVTQVRFERLGDISEADAIAEGTEPACVGADLDHLKYRAGYQTLWESINGEGSWDENPLILAYTFKDISP